MTFNHTYNKANQRIGQTVTDNSWFNYPAATQSAVSYAANAANQYTAVGAVSPTYNANGNLTSDGTFTFGYDAENRLISAVGAGNSAAYTFDAQGRRKTKTVNGSTTVFVTDAGNREVLEYDGASGAIQRWYAYGLGSNDVLNQMNVAAATRATFVPDIQGSVIASLDSSSGTLSKIGYLPYGKSASAGPFGYTAQRIDPETNGIYYYRARHYSPAWGRFLQPDPIGYGGGGSNLYVYVSNDPLNLTDPTGTDPFIGKTVGFVAGAYYGALGAALTPGASYTSILAGAGVGGFIGLGIGALDPSLGVGTLAIIGGVAAGAGDIAGQVITNYAAATPLGNINYGSTVGAILGGALAGAGGTALVRLAPAAIPEAVVAIGAASLSSGPGAFLTATGAALGEHLRK